MAPRGIFRLFNFICVCESFQSESFSESSEAHVKQHQGETLWCKRVLLVRRIAQPQRSLVDDSSTASRPRRGERALAIDDRAIASSGSPRPPQYFTERADRQRLPSHAFRRTTERASERAREREGEREGEGKWERRGVYCLLCRHNPEGSALQGIASEATLHWVLRSDLAGLGCTFGRVRD